MKSSPQLCVFSLGDYAKGQVGFLEAKQDNAFDIIDIDGCDNYSDMYSIQNAVFTTAKKLGHEVELGIFVKDTFFSMAEMDAVVGDEGHSWNSFDEVFKVLSDKRAKEEEERGDAVFLHSHTFSQQLSPSFGVFSRKELTALHNKYASAIDWDIMPNALSIEVDEEVQQAFSKSNTCIMADLDERNKKWTPSGIVVRQNSIAMDYEHADDASTMYFEFDLPAPKAA